MRSLVAELSTRTQCLLIRYIRYRIPYSTQAATFRFRGVLSVDAATPRHEPRRRALAVKAMSVVDPLAQQLQPHHYHYYRDAM